jgi:PAS domain S-box-containing protein
MRSLETPSWTPRTRRARYGTALVLVAAAAALAPLLEAEVAGSTLLVAEGAVALAAIVAGAGPGRLTAVLLAGGAALVERPLDAQAWVRLVLFLAVAMLVAHASGWSRANSRRLLAVRREAARRLRARLSFQRAIAQTVDEGIYSVDRAGRITWLNAAAERMLGYRAGELVGRPLKTALRCTPLEGTCGGDACRVLSVMASGAPFRAADDLLTRRDGSKFPVRYSSAPIRQAGRVAGAVVAFQDISAELRAASRERFLATATEELATSIDLDETLSRVVRLALPQLGDWCMVVLLEDGGAPRRVLVHAQEPSLATAAREMLQRYPIDLEADHGLGRVLRTGEPELLPDAAGFVGERGTTGRVRGELLARIGLSSYLAVPLRSREHLVGAMAFAVAGPGRRFGGADLVLAEELAGRCALAIENARLHRSAQEAVRSRDEMLAVVSHDLRTPLGAIAAAAGAIGRRTPPGPEGDAIRRSAATIGRVAQRLGRLVADLLDLAAIESGRLSISRGPLRPSDAAEEAVEAIRPLAAEAGVNVHAQPASPSPLVEGDRARVQQVLVNVLSNAVSVTPRGGAVCVGYRTRGEHVVFSVADCGPGVAPTERRRIFERYWRGAEAGHRGVGLGLSIAKGIVEAHGGRLWVAARRGRGAVFRFSLPVMEEVSAAADRRAAP